MDCQVLVEQLDLLLGEKSIIVKLRSENLPIVHVLDNASSRILHSLETVFSECKLESLLVLVL